MPPKQPVVAVSNCFKGEDEKCIKIQFTQKWICLINQLEKSKAVTGKPGDVQSESAGRAL